MILQGGGCSFHSFGGVEDVYGCILYVYMCKIENLMILIIITLIITIVIIRKVIYICADIDFVFSPGCRLVLLEKTQPETQDSC